LPWQFDLGAPLVDDMELGEPSVGPCPEMQSSGFCRSDISPLVIVHAWVKDKCLTDALLEPNSGFPLFWMRRKRVIPSSGGKEK